MMRKQATAHHYCTWTGPSGYVLQRNLDFHSPLSTLWCLTYRMLIEGGKGGYDASNKPVVQFLVLVMLISP